MNAWAARGDLRDLDAAYNLARWLTLDARGAETVVMEAYRDASTAPGSGMRGIGKAAFLATVRDRCHAWLQTPRPALPRTGDSQADRALAALAIAYREIVVLHDLEGLTSAEISAATGIELDTVRSRLSTARELLARGLAGPAQPHFAESVFR